MASKDNLLEGFWDHLITKVKQGALATATAAGSSGAQGKLSASLLGTELYRQYKNWLGKTGGESNPQAFVQFANNLGFSKGFINDQAKAFGDFLQANQKQDKGEKFAIGGKNNNQQQPEKQEPTLDGEKPQEPQQPQNQPQAQQSQANKPMTPGEKQRALRAQKRQNMQRESFEFSESAILNEVSDLQLRQFFTQMAQKAFANGEARSAAKHELQTAIVTPTDYKPQQSQGQSQQAPQPQQAQPQQSAPEQKTQEPEPEQQAEPAPQKPAAPVQTSGDGKAAFNNPVEFTPEEKEILNMIPGAGLEKQITAKDPAVQDLARKVMRDAILKYQKDNPPAAPKKQAVKKPQPQQTAQPEQNKPENPQA